MMSLLKLHHISFRIVAVAYPMPLKDPLTLRRINTTSEVKHRAPQSHLCAFRAMTDSDSGVMADSIPAA